MGLRSLPQFQRENVFNGHLDHKISQAVTLTFGSWARALNNSQMGLFQRPKKKKALEFIQGFSLKFRYVQSEN